MFMIKIFTSHLHDQVSKLRLSVICLQLYILYLLLYVLDIKYQYLKQGFLLDLDTDLLLTSLNLLTGLYQNIFSFLKFSQCSSFSQILKTFPNMVKFHTYQGDIFV